MLILVMQSMFQGNPTRADEKEQERKKKHYELGVCRISRKEENQSLETLGSGFVVKDLQIVQAFDCQPYCLVSSSKIFPNDCDIKSYYLDFKKLNKQKLKTIKLGDIASSARINRNLYSGLVVIPIHPSKKCKEKESIFVYRPFKIGIKERRPNQDLQCHFVDDGQPIFSVKHSTLRQSQTTPVRYQLLEALDCYKTYDEVTRNGDRKPYGGAILLKYDDNEYVVVGAMTFTDDDRRGISPVFFRHSSASETSVSHEACSASQSSAAVRQITSESPLPPDLPGQMLVNLQEMQRNVSKVSSNTGLLAELEKIASDKGFVISDNAGSGNCMFYALSEQLNLMKGIKISHGELRRSIVQFLKKNPKLPDGTDLYSFIDGYQSWADYLSSMEQDGTWGDHVILYGTANCYKTYIDVISSQSNHGDLTIRPDDDVISTNPLVLGHVHEVHYVSLQPKQGEEQDVPDHAHADAMVNPNPNNEAARYEDTVPGLEHHNQERNAAVAGRTVSAAAATQKESLQPGETNAESLTIISPIQDGVENTVDAGATETAQQPTPAAISNDQRLIGSSNGEIPHEEVPFSYSLNSPVQDILDERPELLKGFMEKMDKENVWGNGWRFYKELGLPDGREAAMERGEGSPTLNVIKEWISREGRNATVQALISAVNRSERKDCSHFLEKSLRCQLDYVDSPMENVTKEMSSLSTGPREVKFFGDLNDTQATEIVDKLGQDAKKLLRRELESGPNDSNLSTKDLILRRKLYPIRKYTDLLADGCRGQAIKTLREALPTSKGVVGPLLPINKFIRDVGYTVRRNLTRSLSADDHWKVLAEKLEVEQTDVNFHDSRSKNPADEVLRHWEVKARSTVGVLYDILVEIECPLIADLL